MPPDFLAFSSNNTRARIGDRPGDAEAGHDHIKGVVGHPKPLVVRSDVIGARADRSNGDPAANGIGRPRTPRGLQDRQVFGMPRPANKKDIATDSKTPTENILCVKFLFMFLLLVSLCERLSDRPVQP